MAYLLDEIRNGITLSHDFSEKHPFIYREEGFPKLEIEKLTDCISSHLKVACGLKKIEIRRIGWFPNSSINGLVHLDKSGKATIYVNNKLNDCWFRFTVIKELLQLYIDCTSPSSLKEYGQSEIVQQITDLVTTQEMLLTTIPKNTLSSSPFSEKVSTEMQAISMAIDLIFPFHMKDTFPQAILDLLNDEDRLLTSYDVAFEFKIPEYVIDTYYKVFHEISMEMYNAAMRSREREDDDL
jgi:hypothetical protein